MGTRIGLLFIFLLAIFDFSIGVPLDSPVTCYDVECPPLTTSCKKVEKSSKDRLNVIITTSCLDNEDAELKSYNKEVPSPHGPYTYYESTSISGTHTYTYNSRSGSNNQNPLSNININRNYEINNSPERFD